MLLERLNDTHWTWLVYVEMLMAGIAAGAIVAAAILELSGRGQSPAARTARLIAFPLMVLSGLLLIADLSRPARFWHMVVMSERLLPMLKPWSPMSLGSWLVLLFPAFAFVSFLDALIDRGMFRLGGWREGRTLHGSAFGLVWAVLGGLTALAVGIYSGVLLSASQFPGWADSPLIPGLFVATALATGMGALLLVAALGRRTEPVDLQDLARASAMIIVWQMVLLLLFVLTMGRIGFELFLSGSTLLAIIGAVVLGGMIPLVLLRFGAARLRPATAVLAGVMVLIGGFLIRYAVVMGPQLHG